jgi:hypothetical protein
LKKLLHLKFPHRKNDLISRRIFNVGSRKKGAYLSWESRDALEAFIR